MPWPPSRRRKASGKRDAEIKELAADVAALKKQGNPSAAIARLEQDLVVLKSAQDNQPANSDAPTNKEFDVFRIQTTRNITTLQSQVQNTATQQASMTSRLRRCPDAPIGSVTGVPLRGTIKCHQPGDISLPFVTCPTSPLFRLRSSHKK